MKAKFGRFFFDLFDFANKWELLPQSLKEKVYCGLLATEANLS